MLTCTRCGETKVMELFKIAKDRPNGRSSWCKKCHSEVQCKRQTIVRNKEKDKKYRTSEKGKLSQKKFKKSILCVVARRRYNQSDSGRTAQSRWRSNRRDRNLKVVNTLTAFEWNQILEDQDNRCAFCHILFNHENIMTRPERDHIIPLTAGGGLSKENVQALCRRCNAKKSSKLDWDGDTDLKDQTFNDGPHYEIVETVNT